jgi:hypothetical protein
MLMGVGNQGAPRELVQTIEIAKINTRIINAVKFTSL